MGFQLAIAEGKATYEEKNVPLLVLFSEIQHGCMTLMLRIIGNLLLLSFQNCILRRGTTPSC